MAISEVWQKHSGKVVAGLAITTAAYLVYRQLAPRAADHNTSQRPQPSPNQRKISDLEAQTFSEAFKRCRQDRKNSEVHRKTAVVTELECDTAVCSDVEKVPIHRDSSTTLSRELVCDKDKASEAEVVSKDDDDESDEDDDDDELEDEEDECTDDEDEEEGPLDAFGDVIQAVNLSGVGQAALRIRKDRWLAEGTNNPNRSKLSDLTYTMDGTPMCGGYNLVIRIDFSDGVKWIARFPGHGTRFQPADVLKMNSEYNTMRYIREHTKVPMPEVFYVMTSPDMAGVPFSLMSYVEGRTLPHLWHHEMNDGQRLNMLSQIADNMVQLHQLKFNQIGMLDFDRCGKVRGVGPQISVLSEGDCAWARTSACVPLDNVDVYYQASYNQSDHEHIRVQASIQILRIAVETMPAYLTTETKFALTIADMNYQNIIVDKDYNIKAFIDWDGVGTNASVNGCARYPSWITRDWDPAMHNYNAEAPLEGDSAEEHSPEDLRRFRKHYAQAFTSHADELQDYDPRMTTLSHVVEAIELALSDSFIRPKIVMKMFDVAFDHVQPFKVFEYANDVVAGDTSEKDGLLREAFTKAWANEWKEVEEDDVQKDDGINAHKDGEEDDQGDIGDDSLEDSHMDEEEDNLDALFAAQTAQLEKDSSVEHKGKQREVSLNYQEETANDWAAALF